MTVSIQEIGGGRTITIETDNVMLPDSVFIGGRGGALYEFDRAELLTALRHELGLCDCVLTGFEELLAAAA